MAELLEALSAERLYLLGTALLRFIAILILAYVLARLSSKIIQGFRRKISAAMSRGAHDHPDELEKRARTVLAIIDRTAVSVIWVVALVMALKELGFDIGPILAGAGIVGLAVAFGAQNLVRDVITGMFMLVENQLRVGDVAIVNGTGGAVEEINLRTTVLRGLDGTVHVFPNGTITTLSNMTREYSYAVFNVRVGYTEDPDRVCDVIRQVSQDLLMQPNLAPEILAPVEIFGVDQLAEWAMVIQGRIKTHAGKQWMVGRAFNRRLKQRLDEVGIRFPAPHQNLSVTPAFDADDPALEMLVRKVLAERAESRDGSA